MFSRLTRLQRELLMNYRSNCILLSFASLFLITNVLSCANSTNKEVTITKDYVINPNWDEIDNSFEVYKMKLKDSSKAVNLKNPSEAELYHGLTEDTRFIFITNVKYNGTDYSRRKVYFNKYNGFLWCDSNDMHSDCDRKVLGDLQHETWYLLTGLSPFGALHYVYIDHSDSLHVFKVSTMTNY